MTLTVVTLAVGNWLLAALLCAVIVCDVRWMRLPNGLAMLFLIVFAATVAWNLSLDVLGWRIGVALLILLGGMAANAARLIGGDVKILAVLVLFIPSGELLSFAYTLCLSMIASILGLLVLRRILAQPESQWRGLRVGERFPFGISIGLAGLVFLLGH